MADIITGAWLKPISYAGFSLTGTYQGNFLVDFDIASQFELDAVMAESSGADFPTFVRGDPQDKVVPLHIHFGGSASQNRIDDLKEAFSPSRPIAYLLVQDENGNTRRMLAKSLGLVPWEGYDDYSYVASLHAPEPIWENSAAEGGTATLSGTTSAGNDFTMDNRGNERTYPAFRFTPKVVKSNANGYAHHWPITIAWRSPLEGVDSLGGPYPIDITNRAWDTATLIAAGQLSSAADDCRVFVDGVEVDRYPAFLNTTGTSLWCGIAFQPARTAALPILGITGASPANGEALTVSNNEGTSAFPESGTLLIDEEAITYKGKTPTSFLDIRRGRRGTLPGIHTLTATIYWVEHDIRVITNYLTPPAVLASNDQKPMFDINFSSNTSHRYGSDGLIAPETLRPGQWLRERRSPHIGADLLQMVASGSAVLVQDLEPVATKPNFDTISLYMPALGSVTYDVRIGHEFILQTITTDREGFEAVEIQIDTTQFQFPPKAYKVGAPAFGTPTTASELSRLSLLGSIAKLTGSIALTTNAFVIGAASTYLAVAQSFDLRSEDPILGVVFFASKSVGSDRGLQVRLSLLGGTGPGYILASENIATADIPTTMTKFTVDFSGLVGVDDRRDQKLRPGNYIVEFVNLGGTTGTLSIYGVLGEQIYAGGTRWQFPNATAVWEEDPQNLLAMFVTSRLTNGQPNTEFTTGESVAFRNPIANLSSTYGPKVVRGARQDGYLVDAQLTNPATGQAMTILAPLIVNQSLLKIDCDAHAVTVIWMTDDHEEDALWMVEPAGIISGDEVRDLTEWIRLEPGVTTLNFKEVLPGGTNVEVERRLRSRWT